MPGDPKQNESKKLEKQVGREVKDEVRRDEDSVLKPKEEKSSVKRIERFRER